MADILTWQILKFTDLSKPGNPIPGYSTWSDGLSLYIRTATLTMVIQCGSTVLKQISLKSRGLTAKCRQNQILFEVPSRGTPTRFRFRAVNIDECGHIMSYLRNYITILEDGVQNDCFSQNIGSQEFMSPASSQMSKPSSQSSFKSSTSSGSIFSQGSSGSSLSDLDFSQDFSQDYKGNNNRTLYDAMKTPDPYAQAQMKPFAAPAQMTRPAFSQPVPTRASIYNPMLNFSHQQFSQESVPHRQFSQPLEPVSHQQFSQPLQQIPNQPFSQRLEAPFQTTPEKPIISPANPCPVESPLKPFKPAVCLVEAATQTEDELDYYLNCDIKALLDTVRQKPTFTSLVQRVTEALRKDRESKPRVPQPARKQPIAAIRRRGPDGDFATPRKQVTVGVIHEDTMNDFSPGI